MNANASTAAEVAAMYDATADSYASMMDREIDLPVYDDALGRLGARLSTLAGALVDTSTGSGHLLERYQRRVGDGRRLIGIDLSPEMVRLSRARLGDAADVHVGDMRRLDGIDDGTAAGVISFFALHHVDAGAAAACLEEWHRVLVPDGQLLLATWEGSGTIDYGDATDVVAFRYREPELRAWLEAAAFRVDRVAREPVEGLAMDALYVEATRVERVQESAR